MPNWVRNKLSIAGNDRSLKDLLRRVSAPYVHRVNEYNVEERRMDWRDEQVEPEFAFWNIDRPADDDLDWYYTNDNWYHWNIAHWGTKWDVANRASVMIQNNNRADVYFDTAWSPPLEVLQKLSSEHPDLRFLLEYEEEQGWGGIICWDNGEGAVVEEWDIPESHAEIANRGGECHCEEWGEKLFEDCPEQQDLKTVQGTEQEGASA